ncbi:MAG: cobaltochelatase subunit CobN, partial [Pseudomonadota bacterium]
MADDIKALPGSRGKRPRVGLLVLRSYLLSGDTGHYDGVIEAIEARGLDVLPIFASGLDARAAIEKFFFQDGKPQIDAFISLTGFSLVGGPAYNDAKAAAEILQRLDVPYISAHSLEFQNLSEWQASRQGLSPVEATIMVAIPELDGATVPTVFGGRAAPDSNQATSDLLQTDHANPLKTEQQGRMRCCTERAEMLAARIDKLIRLRRKAKSDRQVSIVLFNFPPNSGAAGTAAYLSVFESLHNLLKGMKAEGYTVDVPDSVDALRSALLEGNALEHGADAHVHDKVAAATHIRREPRLEDIEAQWGPAPGRQQTDGTHIHILGARFGNVLVGLQPAFGFEGDPMRLLFEDGFCPTHAFTAFYRYLRNDFAADALIHFGTHGALEFMPGKQTALSEACWPEYLIGDLPNLYFYAANNPSEASLAKRRSAATVVSYLTGAVTKADLYKSLSDLKGTVERWRSAEPTNAGERRALAVLAQAQAASLDLAEGDPPWDHDTEDQMNDLFQRLVDYEQTLIPEGLHVAGLPHDLASRTALLTAMAGEGSPDALPQGAIDDLAAGLPTDRIAKDYHLTDQLNRLNELARANLELQKETEISGLLKALDGRFIAPAPGGDLLSSTDILPTGRNIHGFDPFKIPSAYALRDGALQADRLLERHLQDSGSLPETVAIVLWGADNLKSEGAQLAQALALMGAKPRFDHYGRLAGAELVSLEELGRPRIDMMATLSGIFRDLLPMQTKLLANAA